jgi:hypothetical protein
MKKCIKCGIEKELSEFHKRTISKDGHRNECKQCIKEYHSLPRIVEIKRIAQRKYYKSEKGQLAEKKYSKTRREKCRKTGKAKVYYLSRREIVLNKQKKQCCVFCGSDNAEKHHEDYSKPLEFTWLCPLHHAQRHKEIRCQTKLMG